MEIKDLLHFGHSTSDPDHVTFGVCVCVCARVHVCVCMYVCVCVCVCVCVSERERERESVCLCVCVQGLICSFVVVDLQCSLWCSLDL